MAITGYTLAIHIDPDFAGQSYNKRPGLAYLIAKGGVRFGDWLSDFETAISISPLILMT